MGHNWPDVAEATAGNFITAELSQSTGRRHSHAGRATRLHAVRSQQGRHHTWPRASFSATPRHGRTVEQARHDQNVPKGFSGTLVIGWAHRCGRNICCAGSR